LSRASGSGRGLDAARIDGCTEFGIYRRVILPLAQPALATVALFTFIGTWNDFLGPLLYLTDERTYTLSMGLQFFVSQHGAEWGMLMAYPRAYWTPGGAISCLNSRTKRKKLVVSLNSWIPYLRQCRQPALR
jgi:ABC-type glycerol-3-phosphate transport system permease component